MSGLLDRARAIAEEVHAGQTKKKTGEPVLHHVARVAAAVSTEDETMVAWLHDVLELAPSWSLDRLQREGFPKHIIDAVDALTKRPDESHQDLVKRAASNGLARNVKEADLQDNFKAAQRAGADGDKYWEGLLVLGRGAKAFDEQD